MSPPNIPNGFIELVEFIEKDRPVLPKKVSKEELWNDFCYCALFGPDRVEAETVYVYDLLAKNGMLTRKKIREDGWVSKAENVLNNEFNKIKGHAKDRKRAAIKKVLARIWELHETLAKADGVFNNLGITPALLKSEEEKGKTGDILADLVYVGEATTNPNKIPDVGYTKAVLWLHMCGVGKDYAPDNNHTIKFLDRCGYGASARREDYFTLMHYLRQVRDQVNKNTKEKYTVAEVSHSVFYYESTRSLLDNKYKKYYDPAMLLSFLEKKKWTINDLADDWLFEIEKLDELKNELENFISDTFKV